MIRPYRPHVWEVRFTFTAKTEEEARRYFTDPMLLPRDARCHVIDRTERRTIRAAFLIVAFLGFWGSVGVSFWRWFHG